LPEPWEPHVPEIILEFSLNRSSGVLAGIVASLAQAGIELQSQKLQRAPEGRGGWLTITGTGESPSPNVLAERLNGTRGVEKLMRVIVDGEAVLAEGKPLDNQIQPDDLAELSAGSSADAEPEPDAPEALAQTNDPQETHAGATDIEDLPILSEPETTKAPPAAPDAERGETEPDAAEEPIEQDLATALETGAERVEASAAPEFAAEPTAESDFAEALREEPDSAEDNATSGDGDEDGNPVQVGAVLRRRRRRRR